MKKNNYFQPQTIIERTLPQIVILHTADVSHETGGLPTNPPIPGGGGLGAPRRV